VKVEINNKRFAWIKNLKEKPNFILSRAQAEELNKIARTYESEYASYFNLLLKQIPVGSIDYTEISNAINDCKNIARWLYIITKEIPGALSNEELDNLPLAMEGVSLALQQLQDTSHGTQDLVDAVSTVQKQYGVKPEDIRKQHSKSMGKAAKAGAGATLKGVGSSLVDTSRGLLDAGASSLISSLLGPAAPLGGLAYGAGKGMFNLMMQKKSAKASSPLSRISGSISDSMFRDFYKKDELGRAIPANTSTTRPRGQRNTDEDFVDQTAYVQRPRGQRNTDEDFVDQTAYVQRPRSYMPMSDALQDTGDYIPTAKSTGKPDKRFKLDADKVSNRALNNSKVIYEFFNTKAYQARWTKEVLEELKKISKRSDKNSIGGVASPAPGFFIGTSAIAKALLALSALSSLAFLQVKSYGLLKDKVGKTAARGISSGPGAMLSGAAMDFVTGAFSKKKAEMDPVAAKAEKLLKENPKLSQKDAMAIARRDLGKPQIQNIPMAFQKNEVIDYNKFTIAIKDALKQVTPMPSTAGLYPQTRRDVRGSGDPLLESLNSGKLGSGDN